MTLDMKKLGQRVQRTRQARGWSQGKLASAARISRGYLARVETGRHEPSLTMLDKLAKALKVRMTDLLQ